MAENVILEKSYKFALRVVRFDELRQSGIVQSADQDRKNIERPSVTEQADSQFSIFNFPFSGR
jgi:hypothetical protein